MKQLKLAAGFEKIRNEHAILVWDVRGNSNQPSSKFSTVPTTESVIFSLNYTNAPSVGETNGLSRAFYNIPNSFSNLTTTINSGTVPSSVFQSSGYNASTNENRKPDAIKSIYETGTSETCNSLSWHPHNQNMLLTGVNRISLKIFDIRANTKAGLSVNTKYVFGFSIDSSPSAAQHQAASYFENVVAIWDTRMFEKPIHTVTEQETIIKMQWCPTKLTDFFNFLIILS